MNSTFTPIFNQLEKQRTEILQSVRLLTPEEFNRPPQPGKWSVSEVLTHLITAEKLSLDYMKKKVKGIARVKNSGLMESLRLWLLIVSQRIPVKYKAPKVVVQHTPPAMPLAQLTDEWNEVRKELAAFLNSIPDEYVKRVIYKHALAGRLDVRQAMIFFREHIRHHQPQINRILLTDVTQNKN
ncbi:MAG: DinB family protein [Cyclobacteriaceae bacterium]|nr:DinB family protein [Cyclobacteriaceae bacterium]